MRSASILIVCVVLALLVSSCASVGSSASSSSSWPDVGFIVINEIVTSDMLWKLEDVRNGKAQLAEIMLTNIDQVLLLPIMENYKWKDRTFRVALADPLIVTQGAQSMPEMFRALEKGRQQVFRCIILRPGYAPGELSKGFLPPCMYKGRRVLPFELGKCSADQYLRAYDVITNELASDRISVVERDDPFDQAIAQNKLLSMFEIQSPVADSDGHRVSYSWWNVSRHGTTVPVCMSREGYQRLVDFLRPTGGNTQKEPAVSGTGTSTNTTKVP